jgi:DNA-directed RNA polymerase specialized sigma24 family protein
MLADVRNGSPAAGRSASRDATAAFDVFYTASAPRLVRQLHAMTGDLTEAQDCVQEACARAWQRWPAVRSYDSPEAWVRSVAWNVAVSRFRRLTAGRRALRRHGVAPNVPSMSPDRVALVKARLARGRARLAELLADEPSTPSERGTSRD